MCKIVCNVEEVVGICCRIEPWVVKYRQNKLEEAIQEVMSTGRKLDRTLLGVMLNKRALYRPLTREEAIESLKERPHYGGMIPLHPEQTCSRYQRIMLEYSGSIEKANILLDACRVAVAKNIVLDETYAAFVGSWKEVY